MIQPKLFEELPVEDLRASEFQAMIDFFRISEEAGWPDKFGLALRELFKKYSKIPTLSLFAGGGGLDIAFHDLGFQILESVEIEQKFANTLVANTDEGGILEGTNVVCQDIRSYKPPIDKKIDFIIGGPPCQTFSAAGRRALGVLGTSDDRGTLFEEYVRILKDVQPKGFLFENVYGITGASDGNAWNSIKEAFIDAGYRIFIRLLDSADFGVPQHRERVFIVGIRNDLSIKYKFPRPTHGPDSFGNHPFFSSFGAISDKPQEPSSDPIGGRYGELLREVPPGLNYSFFTSEMGHPRPVFSWRSKFSDFLYKADPDRPIRTLKASGGQYTGPFSWLNRKFTIDELKRLQTFPDAYRIVGSRVDCEKQIGNSVPPQIGRILALSIRNQLFSTPLPFNLSLIAEDTVLGFRQRKRELTKIYRDKATQAISRLEPESFERKTETILLELRRRLTKDFEWVDDQSSCEYNVVHDIDAHIWRIRISSEAGEINGYPLSIKVSPNGKWDLAVKHVYLFSNSSDPKSYQALWKAFEEGLRIIFSIADLVQLSGYYQYEQKFLSVISSHDSKMPYAKQLGCITQGICVGKLVDSRILQDNLDIPNEQIREFLKFLRSIGYEVRGRSTNPQIPEGKYLIPYAFPTLNSRSVQFRKEFDI